MPVSILSLFVIVIGRARAGSRTRADERTFPAANQCPCTCTDGCADADAFSCLLFSGFRISMTSVLAASDGNCKREREHQQ
ncbi:MAG: hypothetical protein V7638_2364 [Acidobacteriota bacterium]